VLVKQAGSVKMDAAMFAHFQDACAGLHVSDEQRCSLVEF
jgi:hypothetical protein